MLLYVFWYCSTVFYDSSPDPHFRATCYCWSYDTPVLFFIVPPQTHTSQAHVTVGLMILQYCFLWFLPRHTLHSHMLQLVLWYSSTVFYGSSQDTHFTATCYCWSYDTPVQFFMVPPKTHTSQPHVTYIWSYDTPVLSQFWFLWDSSTQRILDGQQNVKFNTNNCSLLFGSEEYGGRYWVAGRLPQLSY